MCLLEKFGETTSCQAELVHNSLYDGGAAVLEAAGVPPAVSNLMTTVADKLPIANSTKDFAKELADTIEDEYNNQENWEDGSMCLSDLPYLVPTDCGAFEKGRNIFSDMPRAHKWFLETVEALKNCASKQNWGIPTPFMDVQTSGEKCLPKFFDTMKDQVQQNGPLMDQVKHIRDVIYGEEKEKNRELETSSSLFQSDNAQGSSVIPGKIVFKLALQFRVLHTGVKIAQGLDFAVGVAFHPSDLKVDFFVETALILGATNLLATGREMKWGIEGKMPRMAVILAYAPGVAYAPGNALDFKTKFDCWTEGPKCGVGPGQVVLGGNVPTKIVSEAIQAATTLDLSGFKPVAGAVLAANTAGAPAGATYFSMALGDSGPPPPAFVASKVPFTMTWLAWEHQATPETVQGFQVISGPCGTNAGCVTSPNYPQSYTDNQACTITTSRALKVVAFQTEACCDKLTVNGKTYSGSIGPAEVTPTGPFHWTSDHSVTKSGWKLC